MPSMVADELLTSRQGSLSAPPGLCAAPSLLICQPARPLLPSVLRPQEPPFCLEQKAHEPDDRQLGVDRVEIASAEDLVSLRSDIRASAFLLFYFYL